MAAPQIWIPYCGAAPLPAELMARWNLDPVLLAGLGLLALGHLRSGEARHGPAFWSAFALLMLLFVSPLCALSSALFSVRVVHHVLLAAVIAPLLVLAVPRLRPPGSLGGWTGAQAFVFWLWHAPPVYEWALSGDAAYWLMQLSLLGSAIGFWSAVRRAAAPLAAAALLITMVSMGLLGALITFAGAPLYAPHLLATAAWGYSPLEDQQLAGIIMWAPAGALYLGAAMLLLGRWLAAADRAALAR